MSHALTARCPGAGTGDRGRRLVATTIRRGAPASIPGRLSNKGHNTIMSIRTIAIVGLGSETGENRGRHMTAADPETVPDKQHADVAP